MKSKTKKVLFVVLATFILIILYLMIYQPKAKESIIFFPIDENARFLSADTLLTFEGKKKKNHYQTDWKITSKLDQEAYLRQDIGFLYINGRLHGMMNEWTQKTDQIVEEKGLKGKESSLLQGISFHYAEIHQNEDEITSAQRMSSDSLYVIDSNFSQLNSFREPENASEKEWKIILDKVTNQQMDFALEKGLQQSGLNLDQYDTYLLTEMTQFNDKPIPPFTIEQTAKIIGNLWEGLYKNYFLGLKKEDGTNVNALGSTIPLILVSKDQSHLYVLIITHSNEAITLKQIISI
ncbi:hypothetical protein WAK64_02070 [Bacillus spongiae]|uniref:DUF3919 family protein n=1 Tax=Bacillus spongiae TaxID=2683610 RepID=A0ABU8H9A0_9BACI